MQLGWKDDVLLQAAEGERAAAVEAAQLLQKPAREEAEEPGTEGAGPRPGEEQRMVMQAMHVPHEAGKHLPARAPPPYPIIATSPCGDWLVPWACHMSA